MRYAKVSFRNLAGVTVVISAETNIPMANKEVDLYQGSQATLEIQSSSNDPVIFTAKNKQTEAKIELNGKDSFTVQPSTDPNYNVTVLMNSAEGEFATQLAILQKMKTFSTSPCFPAFSDMLT